MTIINKDFFKTNVTLRITALWAFSEAFMGGILHGLQIPFAGLALSFVAAVCITLIALGSTQKGEILKATLLVIVVKFILSPHTPPMAYIAVLIQGAVGELLFFNKRFFKPAAFILTLFSLLYSAFQHLLILTIIFGKQFWAAIDIFLNKITQSFSKGAVHYSLYIVLFYISCYLVAGIVGGFLNIKLIKKIQAAGVRIDGVGIQGHWKYNNVPRHDIEESIKAFAALGIEVMFTELDLSVLPNPWDGNTAEVSKTAEGNDKMNPYTKALPDSVAAAQAKAYADLFSLFLKYNQSVSRVTFWGVADGVSWLNGWPVRGRTNYPLLFNRQYKPKTAFYSVIKTKVN